MTCYTSASCCLTTKLKKQQALRKINSYFSTKNTFCDLDFIYIIFYFEFKLNKADIRLQHLSSWVKKETKE